MKPTTNMLALVRGVWAMLHKHLRKIETRNNQPGGGCDDGMQQ